MMQHISQRISQQADIQVRITRINDRHHLGRKVEVFSEDYDNILKDIDNTVKFYRTSKSQNPYNFEEEKSIQDINRVIAEYKRLSLESGDFDVLNLNKKMSDIDIESMQAKRSLQQYKVNNLFLLS